MSSKSYKSDIVFNVTTDENKIPEHIQWSAEDMSEQSSCKAILISLWDEKEKNTLKIDLWTKEMTVDEMKQFFHQTLLTMTDSFERATGEKEMCEDMRDFCKYFGEKMKLIKEEENEG